MSRRRLESPNLGGRSGNALLAHIFVVCGSHLPHEEINDLILKIESIVLLHTVENDR